MPTDPVPREGEEPDALARSDYGRYAGMGLAFALTVIAFGAAGWWLDSKLGSTPAFLIAGALAGFAGGLVSMVKRLPPSRTPRGR